MKKIFALVLALALCLCASAVYAEPAAPAVDVSAMTEEELTALIDEARTALAKLRAGVTENSVLFEDDMIRITYAGTAEMTDYGELDVNIIVENLSEHNLGFRLDNTSCNGWAVDGYISNSVPAGKKAKLVFSIYNAAESADLEKVEDLENIEGSISVYDTDSYDSLTEPVAFAWNF